MTSEGRRERKVVSVLFADLVGFTSRAEELDPEDVEAILTPYHSRLRSELERFGGTVEKFIGDAVVAVFGAPAAHEDDPERAVRAALAIRDWVREEGELEVRIAVNTGEALVSLGASPEQGEGMVAGDVVNTASRLQSAAPVNGILIGQSTYDATSRVIECRELEPIDAKGKSKPIPVWEAVEALSRFGSDVTYATSTQLVGRERELDVLVDALALVRQQREPQLVTLVGVPGIGKSRLVQELFEAVEQDPELISWRQGRCLPYGEGVAFWALGEILKAQAGVREGDSEERAAEKLQAAVAEATPEEEEAEWLVRHLRPLLGLADDGEAAGDRKMESFGAWRRYFESLAEHRPLVLVFEDLHWADEGLFDFVDHLVDWAGPVPILVVGTARPELLARRPGWGGGKPNATTLSLSPLNEEETARLLHGLLDRTVLPAEVQSALLERAGGNPLYAEEFARMAVERGALMEGADQLPLPGSVQGLIAARLDALDEEEKALLQDAAVIGKVFWRGSVGALRGDGEARTTEEVLHRLERKQFVRRERRSAVEGDTQYAFLHALVRDVAYGQIPRAARGEKHRRAAAWIESLGRPEDHAEMRAHHYAAALEALRLAREDTTAVTDAARLAFREAGDRTLALSAFAAAARHYDHALELWPGENGERPRLLLAAAKARFELHFDNDEELGRARDALLEVGDHDGAADAEIRIANVHWVHGRGDEAVRHLERAAAFAEPLELSPTKAFVYSELSRFHMLGDRWEPARRFGEAALSMATDLGLDYERASVLNNLGTIRALEGDRGGLEVLRESIAIMERLNSPGAVRSYNNLIYSLWSLGEVRQMDELSIRMGEVAQRWGVQEWLRWAKDKRVAALYFAGRWAEAERLVDELLAGLAEGERHYLETEWRVVRSSIRVARGDDEGAESDAKIAVERARTAADPQVLLPALAWRMLQLCKQGDRRAGGLVDELVAVTRSRGIRIVEWFPVAAQALAAIGRTAELEEIAETGTGRNPWRKAGLELAARDFGAAADTFARMGAVPHEAEARLLAAKAGIDADLPRAIEFFRSVGATSYLNEAEALLAKTRSA